MVIQPVAVTTVDGLWVMAGPWSPIGITAVLRIGVMFYLDGWHLGHQMAIVTFAVTVLALHQVHTVSVWVCGNLEVPIELRDKHLTTLAAMAAGRKAVWPPVLACFVKAVSGDVANTLSCPERPRTGPQGPPTTQARVEAFVASHGGLAVVEGLLLAEVTIRAVLEVVFGERSPGCVVTSLGIARSGTGEEKRVSDVTHSSTERVPPMELPSLTVRERECMQREVGRRVRALVTKQEDKSICVNCIKLQCIVRAGMRIF